MHISKLIDDLTKLRRTYGDTEVDVCAEHMLMATQEGVPVRIDEFGDIIAVLCAATTYKDVFRVHPSYPTNFLMKDDSWIQYKEAGMSDADAMKAWKEAGCPSRMKHKDIVEDSGKPMRCYLVQYHIGEVFNDLGKSTRIVVSSATGEELYDSLLEQIGGLPRIIDNINYLGEA